MKRKINYRIKGPVPIHSLNIQEKKLNRLTLMLFLVTLASCATPKELMSKKPAVSFTSTKEAQKVQMCLVENFLEEWSSAKPYQTEKGYVVQLDNGFQSPIAMSVVTPTDNGSVIDWYESSVWIKRKAIDAILVKCK